MKKLFAVCLLLLYLFPVCACAQTQAEKLMEAYDYDLKVDGGSFEDYTKRVAAGESVFEFSDILRMLTTSIRKDGKDILSLLLKITAVSVLFAVLTNMQHGFGENAVRETVFFVCYLVIGGMAAETFSEAMHSFESTVGSAVTVMNGCVPILTGLLLAGGNPVTASGVNPVVLTGCALLGNLLRMFVVPVLYSLAAFAMVSGISRSVRLDGFCAFLKKLVRWGLCFLMTAFSGLLAVQGFGGSAMDAMSAKTARYIVSNGVPVVGGILSDTLDTVARSTVLIKNATGVAGIVVLFTICILPVAKIAVTALAFHLTAAVIQPVADRRIYATVSALAEVLSLMVGVLCALFVMFVICISMLLCMGG